jgi:hypothetical protein
MDRPIPMVASWQPFVETPPNFFGIKAGDRLHFRRSGDNQLLHAGTNMKQTTTNWRGNAVMVVICLVLVGLQVLMFWHH